jgi:hypothetical protein
MKSSEPIHMQGDRVKISGAGNLADSKNPAQLDRQRRGSTRWALPNHLAKKGLL